MVDKSKIGTTSVIATCRNCSWSSDDYKTASAAARRHAKATTHIVSVERVQSWNYNPKRSSS